MNTGKYIVIEGLDGSGKSTQHERLVEHLQAVNIREPGGTQMAEEIRTIIKNKHIKRSPRTNAFLFSAARADLIDTVVRPAIQKGKTVVSDRNWLSMIAYQAAEGVKNLDELYTLSKIATEEFFKPDLVIFLDVDVATCRQRLAARGDETTDYFDSLSDDYFHKVRSTYLEHITKLPGHVIVDGNQMPNAVEEAIKQHL